MAAARAAFRPLRWMFLRHSLAVCRGCGAVARWQSTPETGDDWCEACVPVRHSTTIDYSFHRWGWSSRHQQAALQLPKPSPEASEFILPRPHFEAAKRTAAHFRDALLRIKKESGTEFQWYPYDTLANFEHLNLILPGAYDFLFEPPKSFADFGAADGALSFYLESLGHTADIYDYGPTNMNGLRGARRLKAILGSNVGIFECDLDSQMSITRRYDLIFFLGLLYHLKNPFYVLEQLATTTSYMFVSTRIARHFCQGGEDVSTQSAAYLLGPEESNDDATNFWIFTEAGLRRLLHRTGWDVVSFRTVGDLAHSNPQDDQRDERAFALLKSRHTG